MEKCPNLGMGKRCICPDRAFFDRLSKQKIYEMIIKMLRT